MTTPHHEAHERLLGALRTGAPCPPVRELLSPDTASPDLAAAYAVQELGIAGREAAGARRVGRKVGLTSRAVQEQLGVDQPDFGVLLDDMVLTAADEDAVIEIPRGTLIAPRIEAEVAFLLDADVDDPTPEAVRAAVGHAAPSLEVVDSRIRDWDISIVDTIADNASSALCLLGAARVSTTEFAPADTEMEMRINGELVSRGSGVDCLGDPLHALEAVARTASELGRPLRRGEIVLSGALGPMIPISPGDEIEATMSGLGRIVARLD